jgi:hypothetical protein
MKTDKVYCIFIFSLSKKRGMGCMIIGYGHKQKKQKWRCDGNQKNCMHLMQSTSNKVWLSGMNLVPNRKMELMIGKSIFCACKTK